MSALSLYSKATGKTDGSNLYRVKDEIRNLKKLKK